MSDPSYLGVRELMRAISARRAGCLELLEHFLARVERLNPALNAVVVLDAERARARARAADDALAHGQWWGPLHGLPMTVKESYDIAGLRTTRGNPALERNTAECDAVAVQRLVAAGAVIFGKTNVPFNLSDFQSYNAIYGTTNNPWDTGRTPGGSSGGSAAALAAGLTPLEAGSDIGGSIRNPAHYCGVYGHKSTWGIIPLRGHGPPGVLAPADISVLGPLARSAEDLALGLEVMAGPDEIEAHGWQLALPRPRVRPLAEYRVAAWVDDPLCPVGAEVRGALERVVAALRAAGAEVDERARPEIDWSESHAVFTALLRAELTARGPDSVFQENLERARRLEASGDTEKAAEARLSVPYHRAWHQSNEQRTRLRWAWRKFFDEWDALVCPAACVPAFPHDQSPHLAARTVLIDGQSRPYWDQLFWAGITGAAYLPSTVAPAGLSSDGLPVGVQIVGPEHGDLGTIELARLLAAEIGGFHPPPGYA